MNHRTLTICILLSYVAAAIQARPADNQAKDAKESEINAKISVRELPHTEQKKEEFPMLENKSEHQDLTLHDAVNDRLNDPKNVARDASESLKVDDHLKSEPKTAVRDHDDLKSQNVTHDRSIPDLKNAAAAHDLVNSEAKNAARKHGSEPQNASPDSDAHKILKA